ncbi:protein of unknown function [Azospirillum lipoferum 4B]|uniref:Uncharacterized protein n=1 Tax=Azospirillum lipoferum (strain 4B) TaxID=862719 RepID=G7Z851_AZOL4|nr:protein of unknown function [Azospirillum lipoferum 4B]
MQTKCYLIPRYADVAPHQFEIRGTANTAVAVHSAALLHFAVRFLPRLKAAPNWAAAFFLPEPPASPLLRPSSRQPL